MPASKAQQKATNKWIEKAYDRINLTVPKGQKDVIKAHAEARGESVNGFIGRAIDNQMAADNAASRAASELSEGIPLHTLEQRVRRTLYKHNMLIRKKEGTYTVVGGDEPHTFDSFGALLAFSDSLENKEDNK